ncbi:serine/threonine-protein kinase [Algoriphagus halophytocola]|uniref:Serine/threonine-protein kinase n=1 Tax=Algoriphagus halophytocola TaxID=2991499 RepID=A0ABY6MG60_9BACT|nr:MULTISPECIES: serine/threonine-protein kinase [unclassified Algoriphagus]UZD22776.1 serine/threonine-protein kinase [Algoriphagus sp. TR-M5]WBL44042.1 serine/threonine-protein kinase [Algoriphagus sp. TR-M9]
MAREKENWNQIEALFEDLVCMPESQKSERLESLKHSDFPTYTLLKSLLDADKNPAPIFGNSAQVILEEWSKDPDLVGTQIGAFRLDQLIGQGAMGSVFKAIRTDGQFDQTVAIKLMKSQVLNSSNRDLFQRERQILAKLNHPGIARLYDGGFVDDGRPYFSMEWVSGKSLSDYSESQNLTIKQRIRLFIHVCEAVSYAHQSLVLHLDLKPQNILVDQSGRVKLLDFGVSKLIEEHQSTDTSAFTLAYASPEQLEKRDLNTASDIYALGVIFIELLDGRHPFEPLLKKPLELKKAILSGNNPNLLLAEDKLSAFAEDLRAIANRCTAAKPVDRYSTVNQIINDLHAFLGDYPISIRKHDLNYKAAKYFRRNRALVASIFIGTLVIFSMGTYYTLQLQKQRDRAEAEAKKANQITELLTDIFMAADPNIGGADTITAVNLLDQGIENLTNNMQDDPELYSDMLLRLAPVYFNLGQYEKGEKIAQQGFEIYTSIPDISAENLASAEMVISQAHYYYGELDTSKIIIDKAFERLQDHKITNGEIYASILTQMGNVNLDLGNIVLADSIYRLAHEQYLQLREAPHTDLAFTLHMMGSTSRDLGDFKSGETFLLQSLAMKRELYDEPHLEIAYTYNYLGSLYQGMEQYEKALDYIQKSYQQRKAILGTFHVETLASMANTARTYNHINKYKEAIAIYDSTLLIVDSLFGKKHYYYAGLIGNQGNSYYFLGDYAIAKEKVEESRRLYAELNPGNLLAQAAPLSRLADIAVKESDLKTASELYLKALEIREGNLPAGHIQITQSQQTLGECLLDLGDYPTAIEYLELALNTLTEDTEQHEAKITQLHQSLLTAYHATNNLEKVSFYEQQLALKD